MTTYADGYYTYYGATYRVQGYEAQQAADAARATAAANVTTSLGVT